MRTPMKMTTRNERTPCVAILVLLATAQSAVNAQDEARWSWQEPHAKSLADR